MNVKPIESKFAQMGARFKTREVPSRWRQGDNTWLNPTDCRLDIKHDRQGEFFELTVPSHLSEVADVMVVQAEPKRRHLLLMVRKPGEKSLVDRFLCGHDEREWFIAAVPGGASSVREAMDALQPEPVRAARDRAKLRMKERHTRKNRAFRRQGEWFFLPEPSLVVNEKLILRHEPLRRGAGKPHFVEQLHRTGGEVVYVCGKHPNGLTEPAYQRLIAQNPGAAQWGWRMMRRNMTVYARGAVRHKDHATIVLPFWHRVLMNTETESRTMANVAFLD